jgi:hypothetical protein
MTVPRRPKLVTVEFAIVDVTKVGVPLQHFYDESIGLIKYDSHQRIMDKLLSCVDHITRNWASGLVSDF